MAIKTILDRHSRREKPVEITAKDLVTELGVTLNTAKGKLQKLTADGYLEQSPTQKGKTTTWKATDKFNEEY